MRGKKVWASAIAALIAILALCGCVPRKYADGAKKLSEFYDVEETDEYGGKYAGLECGLVAREKNTDNRALFAFYFDTRKNAKLAYAEELRDKDPDEITEMSGKWVFTGVKDAVEKFKK